MKDDLQRRVKAEFMSEKPDDKHLTIAPRVAALVRTYASELHDQNPDWLGGEMIAVVADACENFVNGSS